MMTPTVIPVEGRGDLLRFIRYPRSLYPRDSRWVSPLDWERVRFFDPKKNPFFRFAEIRLFLARDALGRDAGRIAAIFNSRYREFQQPDLGFFGFFDAPRDPGIAEALFGAAEDWLRGKGCRTVQGPHNPSSNHEVGLLVKGFDRPPRILMPYNHAYYEELILGAGYRGAKDLVAYEHELDGVFPDRLLHAQELIKKRGSFTLRHVDLGKIDEELARVKLIYNEGWIDNFGFVPFTDEEIDWMARELKPLLTPDLCQFAEVNGEPAGVMLILPDVNQALKPLRGRLLPLGWLKLLLGLKKVDAMRATVMGTRPAYRKLGIDYAFYYEGLKVAYAHRYRTVELSWILADNVELLRPLDRMGGVETKRYRLYEKSLQER
jgi:GNAT superfamily N-acetyltransferase